MVFFLEEREKGKESFSFRPPFLLSAISPPIYIVAQPSTFHHAPCAPLCASRYYRYCIPLSHPGEGEDDVLTTNFQRFWQRNLAATKLDFDLTYPLFLRSSSRFFSRLSSPFFSRPFVPVSTALFYCSLHSLNFSSPAFPLSSFSSIAEFLISYASPFTSIPVTIALSFHPFFFFVAFLEFLILYASPFTSVPIATALSPPLSSTLFFFAAFAKFLILYTSPLLSIPITSAFSPSFFFLPSIRWISRSLHFTFHPRRFLFFVASVQFLPYTSHFSLLSQLPLLSLPSTFFFFQIFHHPILFPLILSSFFAFFLFSFVLLTTALCPSRRLFSSFAESPALRGNHLFFFLALILAFNPSPDLSASFTAYAADPSTRYDRVRERTGQIWISVCYPFPLPASLDKKMSRSRRERSRTKSSGFDTPIPRFEKAFDRWKMNDPQEGRSRASNNPYMGREARFKTVINPC